MANAWSGCIVTDHPHLSLDTVKPYDFGFASPSGVYCCPKLHYSDWNQCSYNCPDDEIPFIWCRRKSLEWPSTLSQTTCSTKNYNEQHSGQGVNITCEVRFGTVWMALLWSEWFLERTKGRDEEQKNSSRFQCDLFPKQPYSSLFGDLNLIEMLWLLPTLWGWVTMEPCHLRVLKKKSRPRLVE